MVTFTLTNIDPTPFGAETAVRLDFQGPRETAPRLYAVYLDCPEEAVADQDFIEACYNARPGAIYNEKPLLVR